MYKSLLTLLLLLTSATAAGAIDDPAENPAHVGTNSASEDDLAGSIAKVTEEGGGLSDELTEDLRRNSLLIDRHQTDQAVANLTRLIESNPEESGPRSLRAQAYTEAGEYDLALADAAAMLKIDPKLMWPRTLRAAIFRSQGMPAEALAEAAAMQKVGGGNIMAHLEAGRIYSSYGEYTKSARAFDRALGIYEQSAAYIARSTSRPKEDVAGRMADLDKALGLAFDQDYSMIRSMPQNKTSVYEAKGELLRWTGDLAGVIAAYSTGLGLFPTNLGLLTGRGIAHTMAGNAAAAATDFALARVNAKDYKDFNEMCWSKAMAGVALESALEDCEIALSVAQLRWPVLDSRAMVYLRMGRLDEAIHDYDEVLATDVRPANSLLGRAIAWSRKGNIEKAAADLQAARRSNPVIEKQFAYYGLHMP